MSEQPKKLPSLGFAGFEDSPAARGGRRRRPQWQIRPTDTTQSEAEAVAARLAGEAELKQGLGRKSE